MFAILLSFTELAFYQADHVAQPVCPITTVDYDECIMTLLRIACRHLCITGSGMQVEKVMFAIRAFIHSGSGTDLFISRTTLDDVMAFVNELEFSARAMRIEMQRLARMSPSAAEGENCISKSEWLARRVQIVQNTASD